MKQIYGDWYLDNDHILLHLSDKGATHHFSGFNPEKQIYYCRFCGADAPPIVTDICLLIKPKGVQVGNRYV